MNWDRVNDEGKKKKKISPSLSTLYSETGLSHSVTDMWVYAVVLANDVNMTLKLWKM
jgi:hypothetical protein